MQAANRISCPTVQEGCGQKRSSDLGTSPETGLNGAFPELQRGNGVQEMRVMVLVCRCANTKAQIGSWCTPRIFVRLL